MNCFFKVFWVFYISQSKRGKKAKKGGEKEGRKARGREKRKRKRKRKVRKEFCNKHINSLKDELSESAKVFEQKYKCRLTKIGK